MRKLSQPLICLCILCAILTFQKTFSFIRNGTCNICSLQNVKLLLEKQKGQASVASWLYNLEVGGLSSVCIWNNIR